MTTLENLSLERSSPMVTSERSDAEDLMLIDGIERGDEDAFRGLFGRYAPTAKALALRIVRQTDLAEEIVQEAFLAVWRNPERFERRRGSVRAWLMGMVHHRAVDAVRREEAQRRRAENMAATATERLDDPSEEVVARLSLPAERRRVRDALGELPAEQREVLELMYFDGLSQRRIAERTGLPLGTVKSRALLAMRRLRTSLGEIER
ncbi:MAG TPA: sigma-70 family RNA polymerase sigma factor [Actinomycetota bacterium]|jgi:RNA polymerase sigma-70 factor (ECF subfamily)